MELGSVFSLTVLDWLPFLPPAPPESVVAAATVPGSLLDLIRWLMAEKRLTEAKDDADFTVPFEES